MKDFTKFKDIPKHVVSLSRENRLNPTSCEEKLWSVLSCKKIFGLKFRQQHPIDRYIADFYNHDYRLVIEVDGAIHSKQKEYDKNRDDYIKASGYAVLRFTNEQVENELEMVEATIREWLIARLRKTHPLKNERPLNPPQGDLKS